MIRPTVNKPARSVTLKSLGFGLLGVCVVAGLADFSDSRVGAGALWIGNHMPVVVFSFMVLLAVGWNGIMARLFPTLALSSRELMMVMVMSLVACFPPTSGLFRYFHRQLTLPWYYLSTGGYGDWETHRLFEYLPAKLFPSPAPQFDAVGKLIPGSLDATVYQGYFTGLSTTGNLIAPSKVPWGAWMGPLLYWGPLVALMAICSIALSLLVHRQWAHHEQLSYPVAQVALSVIRRKNGRGIPDLFRNRLFWWGFFPVLAIYALAYAHSWFPQSVPGLEDALPNIKAWSLDLPGKFPILKKGYMTWAVSGSVVYFCVVGLAYFVASEISLTMGLTAPLIVLVSLWFYGVSGEPMAREDIDFSRAGAYLGYALIMLYVGRTYYFRVLRAAVGLGGPGRTDPLGVMAARVTVAAFTGFVVMLMVMGMDGLIALLFALFLMLIFLVLTRIVCETGIPFVQAGWMPATAITALFGSAAVGPGPLVFVSYLGTILCRDPRECLMPYAATGFKMADECKAPLNKIFGVMLVAVGVALAIGFAAKLWFDYSYGGMSADGYAAFHVPRIPFVGAARDIAELKDLGLFEASRTARGLGKLALISPAPSDLTYFIVGAVLVAVTSMCRFRFARFPIHPVLFLVWGTYPSARVWFSFLIGWGVKALVVRFGGGRVYQNLKPLFVGLVVSELLVCFLVIVIGMIVLAATGSAPDFSFGILAG